jgi:hypothetical protein
MNKRKWWRMAAVLALSGSAASGWYGLSAKADPIRSASEPVTWTRSTPAPTPAISASAVQPVTPVSLPTPPPPLAKPAGPSVVNPEFKAVPPKELLPAVPAPVEDANPPSPMAFPIPKQDPPDPPIAPKPIPVSAPALKIDPSVLPIPVTPIVKPDPVAPPLPPKTEPAVILPIPKANAAAPVVPAPAGLAPSAPPLRSVQPDKPIPPASLDFNLRPTVPGNSFKPEGKLIPPASPESSPTAPFATVSRPKAPDLPMPATEKYVFPLPKPKSIPPAVATTFERSKPPAPIAPLPPLPIPITVNSTPGVTAMTAKQITMATVLGGAMAMVASTASPVTALPLPPKPIAPLISAPALPVKAADAADDVKTLKKDLEEANKRLAETNKEIKRLVDLLEGVKGQPLLPGALKEITELKDKVFAQGEKIASLQKQIEDMKKSTSLKPTPAPNGAGTVRIINDYPIEVTILVNDKTYRVAPNTSLDIPVTAGEFTYQLWSTGSFLAPVKSPIADKEVVKLRIK